MKKFAFILLSLLLAITLIACTDSGDGAGTTAGDTGNAVTTTAPVTDDQPPERAPEGELDGQLTLSDVKTITLDPSVTHQEIESFGASGAWWSQIIGTGPVREKVAKLLFDPVEGIGLNSYRYNIGGGSTEDGARSSSIGDIWRRTESFETEPGVYNWKKDRGAVWFMKRAAELGVDEIVMFVNSPLERMTVNGKTYADETSANKSNLAPENYEEFAKYVLDVAEHFKEEGLPIKYISPINEPQYGWDYPAGVGHAQEGCHYSNKEIIDILRVFVEKIGEREGLKGVEICAPDGGSWNPDTLVFSELIAKDEVLGQYLSGIDNHSYWSTTEVKRDFKKVFDEKYPNLKFRQSEWCQMENGRDLTMESALELAKIVYEDMTILDCVSWQYWIAVSCYDYHDGLIYTDAQGNDLQVPKRLWSLGNYSRFIDRGYTRIDCTTTERIPGVSLSAYKGANEYGEDETVIVIVNEGRNERNVNFAGLDTSAYNRISVNVTDEEHDLEETYYAEFLDGTAVSVPAQSVVTVVISNRTDA